MTNISPSNKGNMDRVAKGIMGVVLGDQILGSNWLNQSKISWMAQSGAKIFSLIIALKTRPSALGKSDPFCGPSNPRNLFTKD